MNDIEESIKQLEKIVKLRKEKTKNKIDFDTCIVGTKDIDNLINKNKELEEKSKNTMELIGANYVHKDKIREKIDSFDKELQKANSNGDEEIKERIWCATATLYELFEEGDDK